ncbi:MAG: phage major capsid protein [Clostridium sp.]
MKKEVYEARRKDLMEKAQNFINEVKIDDAENAMEEIKQLDNDYEREAKAQTNLEALNGTPNVVNNVGVIGTVSGTVVDTFGNADISDDIYATMEYRKAFMNHIIKDEVLPDKFKNANANTKTTDIGSVIPTTVMEKIVEKLENTGNILALVTRTAYKGGVAIPTSSVKPVATWVVEGGTSDKQKKTTGQITFAYYKLRCAVSVSLETDVTSLAVFEATLINNVTEAMVKAIEQAIISGTGTGMPKGILAETAPTGQTLDVTTLTYDTLTDAEGALPSAYESSATYCMTKKTFMKYMSIKDSAGQPIARVNYGIGGKPERTILGRTVIICDYLDSFETTLAVGKVFAFIFNFKDYVLNTNFNMGIKKYEDNETEDQITKSVMLADGKTIDVNSLVVLKKK